jgi:cytochrome c oxidase cbb3-type subunit 2
MRRNALALLLCAGAAAQAVALAEMDANEQARQERRRAAELAKAPPRAHLLRNPLADDPEAVAAGGKLFEEHCQECHGEEARGGKKAPNLRQEEVRSAAPGVLFWFLSNGNVRHGMPTWSKLPEPQRWQLVSFLKSLAPQREAASHPVSSH